MAYVKHVWVTGEMITRDKLNNMEDGIESALDAITMLDGDDTWSKVRTLVRVGLGPKAFPIGTQFTEQHTTYGNVVFDVVSHTNYTNPSNGGPLMTLKMHDAIKGLEFDGQEALYYCAEALPAGQYYFTLSEAEGGGSYGFTLTQPVPAGGMIRARGSTDADVTQVSTHESRSATTEIEYATVEAGVTDGTELAPINNLDISQAGYNHWGESGIRQWLNGDAAAGAWWEPQSIYDTPPRFYTNYDGFLAGFSAEFRAAMCAVNVVTGYNLTANHSGAIGGSYITRDYVFLPSDLELGYSRQTGMERDGSLLPYYDGLTNAEKIVYDITGTHPARSQMTRTARSLGTYFIRTINELDGSIRNGNAYSNAPATAPLICIG